VNEEAGYDAGDRLIQVAARNAQRAAARAGGRAYRASGRRLAILAPRQEGGAAGDPAVIVDAEFVAGPAIRVASCEVRPGEQVSAALERARRVLASDMR
jgi:hypothetical protein